MNDDKDLQSTPNGPAAETDDRRDALKKLGKYAAYVAPFTVAALSAKGATGSGPKPHPASR